MIGYLDEIESDLSRFHRVADPMTLDSPRFFRLARLLPVYGGALALALERDRRSEQKPEPQYQDAHPNVASDSIPTYSGSTLAAISDAGGGEFPGIEFTGG